MNDDPSTSNLPLALVQVIIIVSTLIFSTAVALVIFDLTMPVRAPLEVLLMSLDTLTLAFSFGTMMCEIMSVLTYAPVRDDHLSAVTKATVPVIQYGKQLYYIMVQCCVFAVTSQMLRPLVSPHRGLWLLRPSADELPRRVPSPSRESRDMRNFDISVRDSGIGIPGFRSIPHGSDISHV